MLQDFRFAVRSLRATPAFTAVALIVLALGIGATTAIYSVVDAVALRGLPFERADRLMIVDETNPTGKGLTGGYVAAPNFYDWEQQQSSFEGLAAFQGNTLTTYPEGGTPEQLRGLMVSSNLFSLLRVSPKIGRTFDAGAQVAGRDHVAVISDALWRRKFNADPNVIGKTFTVGDAGDVAAGRPSAGVWEVIGVMPSSFEFPVGRLKPVELWTPYVPRKEEFPRGDGSSRSYNAQVIGRLKDGVTRERAYEDMSRITQSLKTQYPRWFRDRWVGVTPLHESLVGKARGWMFLLLGSVAFVLLIACVNVANLMLARASAKSRDVSVRAALGASRWQLARALLAESLLLSFVGTALGIVIAYWGVDIMRSALPPSLPRLASVGIDLRVLVVATLAAVVTGLFFGLLPALQFSRPKLSSALREGGRSGQVGMARQRARTTLLVAEVALAVVLLVGAGLFVTSFVKLSRVDLGISTSNVLTVGVYPKVDFTSAANREQDMLRAATQMKDVFDRVRALPGVVSAAIVANGSVPMSTGWSRTSVEVPGQPRSDDPDDSADVKSISSDYFKTVRIPLIAGREFTEADSAAGAEPVIIINTVTAERFFKGKNPIGETVKASGTRKIVGVVGAVRLQGPESKLRPEIFTPMDTIKGFGGTILLRTARDAGALSTDVRNAIHAVIPNMIVPETQTFDEMYDKLVVQRKFNMIMLAIFGALAIVIAAVGIYGVMAYIVEQRTQEIGVRMALGAEPGQVLRMILSRATVFMTVGIVIGLAAGWGLARFVTSFLFEVEPHNVAVYAGASAILIASGLVAAALPARRAANVDPLTALR